MIDSALSLCVKVFSFSDKLNLNTKTFFDFGGGS